LLLSSFSRNLANYLNPERVGKSKPKIVSEKLAKSYPKKKLYDKTLRFWSAWGTYKDNEDVWKPKVFIFFVVSDDTRSIGSYAEKVTRHAYDLSAAWVWLVWSAYTMYLVLAGSHAVEQMLR
jgi:hypothetical protein